MRIWQTWAIWMAAALGSGGVGAQVGSVQSLDIRIPVAPQPVRVGETVHVFYELLVTNYASGTATLNEIAVLDASTSEVLKRFEGDALSALLVLPVEPKDAKPGSVPGGMHGALYMTLALDRLPAKLSHRLTLSVQGRTESSSVKLTGDALTIDTTPLRELSPPLSGGTWAALYDPAMERGHRRVFYTVDGHVHLPGRFAIDFVGVDATGKAYRGKGERPSDFFGYGADVLAVSDSVVVAARDDFTEPATLADASEHISMGDASGAYVTLDIGGGRFAFYEHMQPGLTVKVGQKVRRGERLGKVGFTGHASSPQLHFHIASASAPLAAEGMPYHFTRYHQLGGYSSIMEFGKQPWKPLPASRVITKSLPAANVVVSFD